jgi:hypothetical protein
MSDIADEHPPATATKDQSGAQSSRSTPDDDGVIDSGHGHVVDCFDWHVVSRATPASARRSQSGRADLFRMQTQAEVVMNSTAFVFVTAGLTRAKCPGHEIREGDRLEYAHRHSSHQSENWDDRQGAKYVASGEGRQKGFFWLSLHKGNGVFPQPPRIFTSAFHCLIEKLVRIGKGAQLLGKSLLFHG